MCNPLKHKHTTSEHFTKPQFLARIAHMEYVSPKPLNSWFDFEAELQKINGLREERKSQQQTRFRRADISRHREQRMEVGDYVGTLLPF